MSRSSTSRPPCAATLAYSEDATRPAHAPWGFAPEAALMVVQHHPAAHPPPALQVAERRARLAGRPGFDRDRREPARPGGGGEPAQKVQRADQASLAPHHLVKEEQRREWVGGAARPRR